MQVVIEEPQDSQDPQFHQEPVDAEEPLDAPEPSGHQQSEDPQTSDAQLSDLHDSELQSEPAVEQDQTKDNNTLISALEKWCRIFAMITEFMKLTFLLLTLIFTVLPVEFQLGHVLGGPPMFFVIFFMIIGTAMGTYSFDMIRYCKNSLMADLDKMIRHNIAYLLVIFIELMLYTLFVHFTELSSEMALAIFGIEGVLIAIDLLSCTLWYALEYKFRGMNRKETDVEAAGAGGAVEATPTNPENAPKRSGGGCTFIKCCCK